MGIKAKRDGVYVTILCILCGSPKDAKEISIVYANAETGVISVDSGDSEVLANFVVTEW